MLSTLKFGDPFPPLDFGTKQGPLPPLPLKKKNKKGNIAKAYYYIESRFNLVKLMLNETYL